MKRKGPGGTDDRVDDAPSSIRLLDRRRRRVRLGMVSRASNQTDHHGGGTPLTRHDPDLLIRTSWVDASYACSQIQRGRATGNIRALRCRVCLQQYLLRVGHFIQKHCGKVVFLGLLLLSLCCVGLKTTTLETKIEDLWVEDGGRLSHELEYVVSQLGEGSGMTTELVLQLPKVSGANVLTVQSLLLHLDALKAATKVEVYVFDKTWTFKEICNTANFPSIGEDATYSEILIKLQPCMIISVLDCFWEGSKLLGPEDPASFLGYDDIKWTNLNPKKIIEHLGVSHKEQDIEEMLDRAGISSAYQEKPCLDPYDPDCPETAPNYESKQSPDVGAVVTGGCSGFATKFLHWEENLILGGIHKNRSGTITRAEALLSMVQLMGELDMYEFYKDHFKVYGINWNQNASRQILEAWQRTFTQEVEKAVLSQNKTQDYSVYSFSSTSLVDILEHFSQSSILRVVLGYVFMLIYTSLMLMRLNDTVQSHAAVGMAGVLLVALSVAAGLGICSVVGIKFNASSTQIIPFLAMGLGVNDVFLIAHTYAQLSESGVAFREQTGECLKRIGVTVLLTSFGNSSAFFVAAIIPIPAMRTFCLQCAVVTLFHMASILLVYPAIMSLDLKRQREQRIDLFCCFKRFALTSDVSLPLPGISSSQPVRYSRGHSTDSRHTGSRVMHQTVAFTDLDGSHPTTTLSTTNASRAAARSTDACSPLHSAASSSQCLASAESNSCCKCLTPCCHRVIRWSLSRFAKKVYGPFLQQTPVKIVVICLFLVCLVAGIVGIARIKDGLDLTDIVPRFTKEYKFLEGQSKYFGFYHFFAVTQSNFDYSSASGQMLLHSYHQAFQKVDKIIKSDSGNLPDFWLQLFRSWLLEIQKAFDDDVTNGYIVQGSSSLTNATSSGHLGYMLIIQTGDSNNPINKKRVTDGRLVDKNGIIYPPAFYIYLTAWTSNDHLGYAKSQAVFRPKPLEWNHDPSDNFYKIQRSRPLTFAQLAFYLHNLGDTQSIITTIKEIRNICDTFSDRGLPNFPNGIIFTYWEQYINLRFFLMLALIAVLAVDFVVVTIVLVNPWAAVIVVVVMAMVVVELFGFMGLFSIKLNAIPAVILIVAVGVSLQFSIYATMGFLTSTGSRNQRMVLALEYFFAPIFHGAISTLVGVVMLCVSEFQFIFKYFFVVLSAMVIVDMGNGLILIPVLLSIIGPNAEVIPANDAEQLSPPSPEPLPKYHVGADKHERHRTDKRVLHRMPPVDQLSTITEESSQCSSVISVDVVPEVVIKTSTRGHSPTVPSTSASFISGMGRRDGRDVCSGQGHCCSCNRMRSNSRPVSESTTIPSSQQVTKIVATTRVKVEVHSPSPGVTTYVPEYKSKKRKRRDSVNTTVITGFDSSSSDS